MWKIIPGLKTDHDRNCMAYDLELWRTRGFELSGYGTVPVGNVWDISGGGCKWPRRLGNFPGWYGV